MNKEFCFFINNEELYIEQILVELDYPILYTCVNKYNCRYLVLCIDGDDLEYLVVNVSNDSLIKMLNKEIPMREVFLESTEAYLISPSEDYTKDTIKEVKTTELNDDYLPVENALFEIESDSLNQYVDKIKEEDIFVTFETYFVTNEIHRNNLKYHNNNSLVFNGNRFSFNIDSIYNSIYNLIYNLIKNTIVVQYDSIEDLDYKYEENICCCQKMIKI